VSRIIALANARNEARNIDRFCRSYQWADRIIIADCGCEDDTVQRAMCYENVEVRPFQVRVHLPGATGWRTPQGKCLETLIGWASDYQPDFLVYEDVDCVPNGLLRNEARQRIEAATRPVMLAQRIYLWGEDQWFPNLSTPWDHAQHTHWFPTLWAWRADWDLGPFDFIEREIHYRNLPEPEQCERFTPPLCTLHYTWPDIAEVQRKLDFLRHVSGEQPNAMHPLKFGGPLAPLPDWAHI